MWSLSRAKLPIFFYFWNRNVKLFASHPVTTWTKPAEEVEHDVDLLVEEIDTRDLVVFNDDFNTFEHVIQTLIRICKHTPEQAEQCTWLIHYKGKCAVKSGVLEELRPMKDGICEAGIDARIL